MCTSCSRGQRKKDNIEGKKLENKAIRGRDGGGIKKGSDQTSESCRRGPTRTKESNISSLRFREGGNEGKGNEYGFGKGRIPKDRA